MPPLPKFDFKLETIIYYFQGVLFLGLMGCFVYIIGAIIKDKIRTRKERRNK
jgi:hypothetical protein